MMALFCKRFDSSGKKCPKRDHTDMQVLIAYVEILMFDESNTTITHIPAHIFSQANKICMACKDYTPITL